MCIGEGIHQKELEVIILSLAVGQKKKKNNKYISSHSGTTSETNTWAICIRM